MPFRRVITEPPWSTRRSTEDELVLRGRTERELWGFGQHPATSLCLSVLAGLYASDAPRPQRVVELSCGSGLLCIAAAALGAESVIGLDESDVTRALAEENARINDAQVRFQSGSAHTEPITADLVIANLTAQELLENATRLAQFAPRGLLLAAGFLESEREEIEQRFIALDFRLLYRETREEFLASVFKSRAGDRRNAV
jgi:ribosomal protein L11 methyltransferase